MPGRPMSSKAGAEKQLASFLLFAGLAAAACWTVFGRHDLRAILLAIRGMDKKYILLAMAASFFFVLAEGGMIWYLLRCIHGKARLLQCVGYSFIGFFFSGITPSATGGQPMQLYYMKQDSNDLADSTVVLMSVAMIYKFVLALIGIGLLLSWRSGLVRHLGSFMWLYYLGLLLNLLTAGVLLGILLFPSLLSSIVCWGERLLVRMKLLRPSGGRPHRIADFISGYRDTVVFFEGHKGQVLAAVLMTCIQRCSIFLLTYLVYRGFYLQQEGFLTIMALRAAICIAVDMLPLPGAQGITELIYGTAFAGIFTGEMLPAAMCVTRGIDFYLPLCAGFLVLYGRKIKASCVKRGIVV